MKKDKKRKCPDCQHPMEKVTGPNGIFIDGIVLKCFFCGKELDLLSFKDICKTLEKI